MSDTNENIYEILYLSDLTGDSKHQEFPLSQKWINALSKTFPEQVEKHKLSAQSRAKRALVPKTKLVIRCTSLTWAFIQAFASVWVILEEIPVPNPEIIGLASRTLRDALLEMTKVFVHLDDDERCVYVALVKSMTLAQRLKQQYPTRQQVIENCQNVCPEQASHQNLEAAIDRLLEKKVFKKPSEETLWVVL